jgi:cytochrome c-type biogenesis protein CcmH/NrfG
MRLKAIAESALVGVVVALFSFRGLIRPATLAAVAIRRRMPDAWFSSAIVWYATGLVLAVAVTFAIAVSWIVYKKVGAPNPKLQQSAKKPLSRAD